MLQTGAQSMSVGHVAEKALPSARKQGGRRRSTRLKTQKDGRFNKG